MNSNAPIVPDGEISNVASSGSEYEVFLSFRGPDTRAGFTDSLYVRLIDAGIRTYRDDEELRKGETIGPDLLKGIKESKIAIPIFSKRYAESKWCLNELAQIVECKRSDGLKVMPIFYDVTPSEVRNQTGDYAKAFESHEKCYDENIIRSWKRALREVGELSGWDNHSGTSRFFKKEGELIKEVTKMVLRELKKAYLVVTDYLVGVEHHVKIILTLLSTDTSAVQIIGIHGMGGIGKTTVAKIVYNHLLPNYENHSFLADVRETCRSRGMKFLYERLISDILGTVSSNISNDDEGINIIRGRFPTKKAVILLDDVDEISQLKGLIGKRDFFGRGSRIIVTTRNKNILNSFEVDCSYELIGLETHLALQLFCKHAFRNDNPPKEYSVLSQKAVRVAAGLPLALEVFGSHLCGKSGDVWESILNKLEKVPHQEIRRKLSVTYDALDVHQKQIFLDIACFFIGDDYRTVIHFWEESQYPREAMDVLQQMSLLKIQNDHELWMHDQLRDLGREIVREEHREPEKCSRLWNEDEATNFFMENKGNENIQGICVDFNQQPHCYFSSDNFATLPNLRLLLVNCEYIYDRRERKSREAKHFWHRWYSKVILEDILPRGRGPFIFSKLRWLSWPFFPGMHNTRNISFENLAILDLSSSSIKSSWAGWSHIKKAKNLKVLNLSECEQLVKTPDFSFHPLLEQLILRGCRRLVEIDRSISVLKHLVVINLGGCVRLKKLPKELSCMDSLEKLIITKARIVEIPSWPLMTRLRVFCASDCRALDKVNSLDFAINITELSLRGCREIKTLPESIGDLVSLVHLDLSYSGLIELPHTIGKLKNLKTLDVCVTPLGKLPTAIEMMENLLSIEAQDCYKLHGIPKLPQSLIKLKVSGARTPAIPDLSNLINLKHLYLNLEDKHVYPFEAWSSAPCWIGRFTNLETFALSSHCIVSLHEDLIILSHLRTLTLIRCTKLQSISKLPLRLTSLKVQECGSLRTLMDLPSSLTSLEIWYCRSLRTSLDLSHLRKLYFLEIMGTPISKLKGFRSHELLHEILLEGCEFSAIDDLDMLGNLEALYIFNCTKLQSLPNWSSLKKLIGLSVMGCPNLVEIPGIGVLENLARLRISNCEKLQCLPDLSNLKKLNYLEVRSCPSLVEITGRLESLSQLDLRDCQSLEKLVEIPNYETMEEISIKRCGKFSKSSLKLFTRT